MTEKTQDQTPQLFDEVADVVERGGYSFRETITALTELINHYTDGGQLFLNNTTAMEIAQFRQKRFEKSAAVPDSSTAGETTGAVDTDLKKDPTEMLVNYVLRIFKEALKTSGSAREAVYLAQAILAATLNAKLPGKNESVKDSERGEKND